MKIQYWSLIFVLALTACSTTTPAQNDASGAVSNSSDTAQMEASSVAQTQSSARLTPVTLEQALDREFSSQKLGIALRYPSTAVVGDCADPISVTAREKEYSVEFVLDHAPDATCADVLGNVFNVIYAQRVSGGADVQKFIDRVFSSLCEVREKSEYAGSEDEEEMLFSRIFLQSKTSSTGETDFGCSESLTWNRTTGVILFSPLASKTGGGIHWPSQREILMPDGSIEGSFDFPIMQSVRFLKP